LWSILQNARKKHYFFNLHVRSERPSFRYLHQSRQKHPGELPHTR
jgi:hypothetical protein